mmetsp:Transcript_36171/g.66374  ORF Transcript_36171/g.66374 Transcript_36171/m.66374 type:complete len:283 (+) Transcript_36171:70-918(+)
MSSPHPWAVITGGSSGIGAAIFRRLVQQEPNLHCLAVGRRLPQLEEARRQAITSAPGVEKTDGGRVHIVSADVSTPEGVSAIVAALPSNASVKYLIHNAGVLGPIAPLTDIDRSTWHQIVATNLDAPLFLTQALLPHLKRCGDDVNNSKTKARVLHVSSGAANSAYVGWGPYCVTKAGLQMMYRCLSEELSRHDVLVGSARPGVVDTPMMDEIRGFDGPAEHFPMQTKIHSLHETGQLETPDNVAAYFHWLLSEMSDEDFGAQEWDLRDSKDDERWKKFNSS